MSCHGMSKIKAQILVQIHASVNKVYMSIHDSLKGYMGLMDTLMLPLLKVMDVL